MHPKDTTRQQFVRLCECGCGQPTLVVFQTDRRKGNAKGQPHRFIYGHTGRGARNPKWRGGRSSNNGYRIVFTPNHPHATSLGYVFEHRLVMESVLGRYLTASEIVHHKDGNTTNNAPENLEVMTRGEHNRRHGTLAAYWQERVK